jgi:hypothetical protein
MLRESKRVLRNEMRCDRDVGCKVKALSGSLGEREAKGVRESRARVRGLGLCMTKEMAKGGMIQQMIDLTDGY